MTKRKKRGGHGKWIGLPPPEPVKSMPLHDAIVARRSVREFKPDPLTEEEISVLLWSAQGVTGKDGGRTIPSAGQLYPLEILAVRAEDARRYVPAEHALELVADGDQRPSLYRACLQQDSVKQAPLVVVITGIFKRLRRRYGDRAERYSFLEAGHAAQNMHLQAVALGIGSVAIGAFNDREIVQLLKLPAGETPL
ncbi:MAG: SagB/ThcOx family dehydrogenase, partial [Planctomycetota bacterium]